jgi:lipocalin-like protein
MIDQRIIGTWRLRSTKAVDDHGKPLPLPLGPMPNGVVFFQADGRMYSIICDGRAHLPGGEQRVFIS